MLGSTTPQSHDKQPQLSLTFVVISVCSSALCFLWIFTNYVCFIKWRLDAGIRRTGLFYLRPLQWRQCVASWSILVRNPYRICPASAGIRISRIAIGHKVSVRWWAATVWIRAAVRLFLSFVLTIHRGNIYCNVLRRVTRRSSRLHWMVAAEVAHAIRKGCQRTGMLRSRYGPARTERGGVCHWECPQGPSMSLTCTGLVLAVLGIPIPFRVPNHRLTHQVHCSSPGSRPSLFFFFFRQSIPYNFFSPNDDIISV